MANNCRVQMAIVLRTIEKLLQYVTDRFLKTTHKRRYKSYFTKRKVQFGTLFHTYLTFCVGFHRSEGNSPLCGSSTGGCKIEIHTSPDYKIESNHQNKNLNRRNYVKTFATGVLTSYIFGCHILVRKRKVGGEQGQPGGKDMCA